MKNLIAKQNIKSLKSLLRRKRDRIGIDVGSYAIKIVELSGAKDDLKINNIAYVRIADPNSKNSLIQAIKEAVIKANVTDKDVSIAVSGPSVIVRFLELPAMNEKELENAISFEAEKYIPFSINEVVINHHLLIPRLGNENKMLVLLVAAKKEIVAERLNLLNEAKVSVGVLDVASFADINAFLGRVEGKKEEIVALVDIGAKATDINIIDGGVLYFTRSIQLGGADITKVLSGALSVDLQSAEDIKLNPGDKAALVNEKIEPILHNIIDEIRLSFSYYENQSGKSIQKVHLTGGSSRAAGLDTMLKENLGIEVVLWDPTEGMAANPSVDQQLVASIKDQLGVAIGLALR